MMVGNQFGSSSKKVFKRRCIFEYHHSALQNGYWIKMSFENQPENGVEAIKGMQDATLTSLFEAARKTRTKTLTTFLSR
jgi:hypothetical protein